MGRLTILHPKWEDFFEKPQPKRTPGSKPAPFPETAKFITTGEAKRRARAGNPVNPSTPSPKRPKLTKGSHLDTDDAFRRDAEFRAAAREGQRRGIGTPNAVSVERTIPRAMQLVEREQDYGPVTYENFIRIYQSPFMRSVAGVAAHLGISKHRVSKIAHKLRKAGIPLRSFAAQPPLTVENVATLTKLAHDATDTTSFFRPPIVLRRDGDPPAGPLELTRLLPGDPIPPSIERKVAEYDTAVRTAPVEPRHVRDVLRELMLKDPDIPEAGDDVQEILALTDEDVAEDLRTYIAGPSTAANVDEDHDLADEWDTEGAG